MCMQVVKQYWCSNNNLSFPRRLAHCEFLCFTALVYHVPQFLESCGSISLFNCQPVEKKNHEQSRMFHRGTQKGGRQSKYTIQVMEKENRKIFASTNDLHRIKRNYMIKEATQENIQEELPGSLATFDPDNQEEG